MRWMDLRWIRICGSTSERWEWEWEWEWECECECEWEFAGEICVLARCLSDLSCSTILQFLRISLHTAQKSTTARLSMATYISLLFMLASISVSITESR
jgi:hypothetical protein